MERIELLVVTKDEAYGKALSKALISRKEAFSVELVEDLKMNQGDIFLVDGGVIREKAIILREKRTQVKREDREWYKYGEVSLLVDKILCLYGETTGKAIWEGSKENLMVVASSFGGSGTTSLALGLAQEYKRYVGEKVCYLTLEKHPSTSLYFPLVEKKKGLREFLYYFTKGKKDICSFLGAFMVEDDFGVMTFSLSKGYNPIHELSGKEFQKLLFLLLDSHFFQRVIVDGSNQMDEKLMVAMEAANSIQVITQNNARGEDFKAQLNFFLGEEKVKDIKFLYRELEEEDEHSSWKIIPYDIDSFYENEISLDGTFGMWLQQAKNYLT